MLTAAAARSLPPPTESQWRAFADHLVTVHSWYKHLPLFNGGEFVVFLAPDAGRRYPLEHPKLPTENTCEGYRRAFGHLDYIWRTCATRPFDRDGGCPPRIGDDLLTIGRLNLYPFVSHEFYWCVHENDVERIRNGVPHPLASAILDAYDCEQHVERCWDNLSESDRELILVLDDRDFVSSQPTFHGLVRQYMDLVEAAQAAYRRLQEPEITKIRHCLERVRQWLG